MKTTLSALVVLAAALCAISPKAMAACEEVPAGQTFRVRLLQPVSSYSTKAGTLVRGILIESPRCDGTPLLPEGATVEGEVKSVHRVGLGFRYETAALEMEFDRIVPADGAPIQIQARVQHVDNARERVRSGIIRGIRATNTPQDHLTSRVEYFAMWSPSTFWILPAYRMAVPFLPEPEIHLPTGTDLIVDLVTPVSAAAGTASTLTNVAFSTSQEEVFADHAAELPNRTVTSSGHDADAVNLVFLGSQEQIESAFQAAGWVGSDPMSARTAFREIGAFLSMRNYPRGPMSRQVLQGTTQDISLQKGLDSLALRDHLRIWSTSQKWFEQPVWFAASTQDVTATLAWRKRRFVHHVDGRIDAEREKIVRDLSLAGCVAAVGKAQRPTMPFFFQSASGDQISTDGNVAVVQLKECDGLAIARGPADSRLASRPQSMFVRYLRTQILSFRDLWRENAGYGILETSRMTFRAIRRGHERRVRAQQLRQQNPQNGLLSNGGPGEAQPVSD